MQPTTQKRFIFLLLAVLVTFLPCAVSRGGPAAPPVRGFLEIARDPAATDAQKRTIAAMMEFAKEADPEAAFAKLQASDVLTIYGGDEHSISDLTPLSRLTHLKTLVLYNNHITDLTPLSSLENLHTLRLEVNRITDISPLAKLKKLESLQITDNRISDLRPLSGLTQLRTLWLSNNQIEDISPLRGLSALQDLHLTGNQVTDLGIFAELALCDLRLGGNGIVDISALRQMNQATTCFISLDLSDNAIRDLTAIGGLERVVSINLANNRIEDAGALRNPAINYLDLEGNRLTRIPNLGDLKLSSINLRGNPIEDYADLIAYKKEHPMVEITVGEEFKLAYENSIPGIKELEDSPVLGVWRTGTIESEWGPLVLELRFLPNGMFYHGMIPAAPGDDVDQEQGFSTEGRFEIKGRVLLMTLHDQTSEHGFEIKNEVLTLEAEDQKVLYRRFKGKNAVRE